MELVIFEENKPFVLQALGNGDFDYIESASEVFETDFFRFIKARAILNKLAESYPTPRKEEDVPLWLYVSSNLSMRLHGVHSFNAYPGSTFRRNAHCFWAQGGPEGDSSRYRGPDSQL